MLYDYKESGKRNRKVEMFGDHCNTCHLIWLSCINKMFNCSKWNHAVGIYMYCCKVYAMGKPFCRYGKKYKDLENLSP